MLLLLIYHCHHFMLSALGEVTLFFDIIRVHSFGAESFNAVLLLMTEDTAVAFNNSWIQLCFLELMRWPAILLF